MKKAFTLIELLAVILVLAIIIIIAVPNITNIIKQNTESSLISSANLIVRTAEQAYLSNKLAKNYDKTMDCSDVSDADTDSYKTCTIKIINKKAHITLEGADDSKFDDYKCVGTLDNVSCILKPSVEGKSITINKTLTQGTEYDDGTYIYHYKQEYTYNSTTKANEWSNIDTDGWGVTLKDKTVTEVNTDPYSYINGKPIVSTSCMFYKATNLTKVKLDNFDTSNVVNMNSMFSVCTSLTNLDVSNFDTSKVTNMRVMFQKCPLTNLDLSNFDTSKVTDMQAMFYWCEEITSLDVSNFDTSQVTNMSYMFGECSSLTSLDVSNFDTSMITTLAVMFYGCSSLTNLDVSNFDTSNVTDMSLIFGSQSAMSIEHIYGLENWDTSKVTSMRAMFQLCSSLVNLDVSKWDTSNVTQMSNMFYGCSILTSLDLSNFDTSNVTIMKGMFENCSSLTSLNLSTFDTSKVTDMHDMFGDDTSLRTLNLTNKFNMNAVTNSNTMFYNDSNLVISVSNSTLQTKLNSLDTSSKPATVTVQLV